MDRRSAIKHVVGALGALKMLEAGAGATQQPLESAYRIQSSQIIAYLNKQGEITGLMISPGREKHLASKVVGRTVLAGCIVSKVTAKRLAGGGVEFTKKIVHAGDGQSCQITERFLPGKSGSVRWELEILGDGPPWSTPIETHLAWPATAETKFWTTWGDSRPENSPGWNDPLIPASFGARSLHYGASDIWKSQGFSVPIATVLDAANDVGLSLALDPGDSVIEMDLNTTPAGEIVFARSNSRISKDRPMRFAMDLVAHAADWRGGLGWMVERYPEQFNPPTPLTYKVAGNAAYAEYEGKDLDAYKFMSMGFRVNWKASFDFYTMGFFLPPVGDEVEFVCPRMDDGTAEFPTSIAHLREYSEQMRRSGFYVLNYFNVGQFGFNLNTDAPPPRKIRNDADLWRDPNEFAWYVLRDAFLYEDNGKIRHGSQGDIRMDVGEPVYMRLMLEEARQHIQAFPASSGLCLDEMQFERNYNPRRDDGLTWRNGKPARAMVNSWKAWMDQLGPLMNKANKVIYANPLYRRMDLMRHLDGFYDEFGFQPYSLNTNSFMAVRKPYMAWTVDLQDPDPDSYFQRHLHMGANVSAPFPMDNHAIMPSGSKVDRYYVDYGPLFDAMQGRTWVLEPRAILVEGQKAKANLFAIPGGYLAFATFGGENASAKVTMRGLSKLPGQAGFSIEAIHPGESEWSALSGDEKGEVMTLNVPLKRGCAAVKLSYLWMKPAKHYFIKEHTVTLGTTLTGAQIRYTLDGKDPAADSALYSQPFTLKETTTVKATAFKGGSQSGPVLEAEMVKVPPPAPWIDPFQGTFNDRVSVEIRNAYPIEGAEIRYTLDGGVVTRQSPLYSGPLEITSTTPVRTRTFVAGLEPSVTADRRFSKLAPVPPLPDVYVSDLAPIKSEVVWRYTAQKNQSIEKTPLSIAGKKFARGVGLASPAEMTYKLEPDYERFVAVVGLDDNVKGRYSDMALFRVFVRNSREELLLHESPMLYPGESWPMEVRIPLDCQEIRLEVTGGMDWERVDWVNAGFILDHSNRGEELLQEIMKAVASNK
jgi:hypothetical protein